MSDVEWAEDDRGGTELAGSHPDENDVAEQPHPDDDVEDES
jgi:hypothetical protein